LKRRRIHRPHLAADLHSNAEVTRGRCGGSTEDGSPPSARVVEPSEANAGVLPPSSTMVKKAPALAWSLRLPGVCPFARERRVMEGTSGWSTLGIFADARRHATLPACAPCKSVRRWQRHPLTASLQTGEGGVSRHEVPGAIGVGAKSRTRAIATGMSGIGCPTPDLEKLRRLLRSEGDFRASPGSRLDRAPRGSGCSSGPWSCSWRHPPAEVARARAASIRSAKAARKEV
jgi:hypothetical protein